MKNLSPKASLIIGIVCLALAGFVFLNPYGASSAERQACEDQVRSQYGNTNAFNDLFDRCSHDVGFVALMATQAEGNNASAAEAAQAVSTANRSNLGTSLLGNFFLGLLLTLGIVLTIKGLVGKKNS